MTSKAQVFQGAAGPASEEAVDGVRLQGQDRRFRAQVALQLVPVVADPGLCPEGTGSSKNIYYFKATFK